MNGTRMLLAKHVMIRSIACPRALDFPPKLRGSRERELRWSHSSEARPREAWLAEQSRGDGRRRGARPQRCSRLWRPHGKAASCPASSLGSSPNPLQSRLLAIQPFRWFSRPAELGVSAPTEDKRSGRWSWGRAPHGAGVTQLSLPGGQDRAALSLGQGGPRLLVPGLPDPLTPNPPVLFPPFLSAWLATPRPFTPRSLQCPPVTPSHPCLPAFPWDPMIIFPSIFQPTFI